MACRMLLARKKFRTTCQHVLPPRIWLSSGEPHRRAACRRKRGLEIRHRPLVQGLPGPGAGGGFPLILPPGPATWLPRSRLNQHKLEDLEMAERKREGSTSPLMPDEP